MLLHTQGGSASECSTTNNSFFDNKQRSPETQPSPAASGTKQLCGVWDWAQPQCAPLLFQGGTSRLGSPEAETTNKKRNKNNTTQKQIVQQKGMPSCAPWGNAFFLLHYLSAQTQLCFHRNNVNQRFCFTLLFRVFLIFVLFVPGCHACGRPARRPWQHTPCMRGRPWHAGRP